MKTKLLSIFLFLMGCSLLSDAQDTLLPQSKSTIYLLSGKAIKDIRLWKIDSLKIEYVKNGNLADVKIADVSMIEYNDGTKKHFGVPAHSDSSGQTVKTPIYSKSTDYFALGKHDGKTYYKGYGAFAGGALSGFGLMLGAVPAVIIASVPPNYINHANPNIQLLTSNPEYCKGYKRAAHNKKIAKTALGLVVGSASLISGFFGYVVLINIL